MTGAAPDQVPALSGDGRRILLGIIKQLAFPAAMWRHHHDGDVGCRFGLYDQEPVQVGDLVLCQTARDVHDWVVGFVHEIRSDHHMVLREVGGTELCEISNEGFLVWRAPRHLDHLCYEGSRRLRYDAARAAFWEACEAGPEWNLHRIRMATVDRDGVVTIEVRQALIGDGSFFVIQIPAETEPDQFRDAILAGLQPFPRTEVKDG